MNSLNANALRSEAAALRSQVEALKGERDRLREDLVDVEERANSRGGLAEHQEMLRLRAERERDAYAAVLEGTPENVERLARVAYNAVYGEEGEDRWELDTRKRYFLVHRESMAEGVTATIAAQRAQVAAALAAATPSPTTSTDEAAARVLARQIANPPVVQVGPAGFVLHEPASPGAPATTRLSPGVALAGMLTGDEQADAALSAAFQRHAPTPGAPGVLVGSAAPEWIRPGVGVFYRPSLMSTQRFSGVVAGWPRLLGEAWVVGLRDMHRSYRDGARSTVPAAACDCLDPAADDVPPEGGVLVGSGTKKGEHPLCPRCAVSVLRSDGTCFVCDGPRIQMESVGSGTKREGG